MTSVVPFAICFRLLIVFNDVLWPLYLVLGLGLILRMTLCSTNVNKRVNKRQQTSSDHMIASLLEGRLYICKRAMVTK